MKRAQIRALKRAVFERHDRDAALALLRHSFALGHKRLVLIRYLITMQLDAEVDNEIGRYCRQLVLGLTLGEIDHLSGTAQQMLKWPAPPAAPAVDNVES